MVTRTHLVLSGISPKTQAIVCHLTQVYPDLSLPVFVLLPWSCRRSLHPLCCACFCCSISHSRAASTFESPPVQSQTPCTDTEQKIRYSRLRSSAQRCTFILSNRYASGKWGFLKTHSGGYRRWSSIFTFLHSHLVPVGLCRVSVHACFGFVDKVAEGIHLQRAVQV